jgi:hypothetical protein
MIKRALALCVLICLAACQKEGSLFSTPPSEETGLDFINTLTESDDLNILDYLYFYNGGGVSLGDIDNDGLVDVFLSGNQVKNQLYLNKGNLKFENISEKAGILGNSTWNTGAVMGDINGDGLLDIYVCAVVGINGFNGHNELFINNGDKTFTESAASYGLDIDSYSSSAAFLDYDLDGDLDIYLLNHAVHTQESFGLASLRNKRNYETGDKLLRNDGNTFTEVSEDAGIYGGINSYGLGVAISDFNQDGFPDIYVGNDFHEDDYYYLNNGDGTFSEKLKKYFGHTSRFSMGNDVADLNHDGWPDIISLDMLAEDEKVLKSSEGDDDIQTHKLRTERYGYHHQYTRNMLYINRPGYQYQEQALMSGVAATDWSWSALFGDYNQDGEQDLFISNGIPKRPNDLDYINYVSSDQIQKKISNTKLIDQSALRLMPSGSTHNYVFEGNSKLAFKDQSAQWITTDTLVSGATAYADLDNDGDLDIVTNNINQPVSIYVNKTNGQAHYLKLKLKGTGKNTQGIGAKVYSYHKGILQYKELYTARGFQASSEPMVHFGYGDHTTVDSIRIIWPNNQTQLLRTIQTDQTLTITPENTLPFVYSKVSQKREKESQTLFTKTSDNLGIDFTHKEDRYLDFNRQKLIPYQISDRGPAMAVGDLNGDGKEDLFFGGSKYIPSQVFIQGDSAFAKALPKYILKESITEDVVAAIHDFNADGKKDLLIGTGGGDFSAPSKQLLDKLYTKADSSFVAQDIPELFGNAAVLAVHDYNNDGTPDVFVGNQAITNDFGTLPNSYLLKNIKGVLANDSSNDLGAPGMITDAVWDDFNGDGEKDLIVVGEWMAPSFYANIEGKLEKTTVGVETYSGLWQSITPFDIDKDGDMDYLLGNWGENSKFVASEKSPMRMYKDDFDGNGQSETIVATVKNGKYYPLLGLGELSSQLVSLNKKYATYGDFAGQEIEQILTPDQRKSATVLEVNTLKSGYLKNDNGQFTFVPFVDFMQVGPILTFCTFDFDGDGVEEVLSAGNYFGVKPFHGRMDSFSGALIKDADTMIPGYKLGLDFAQKSIRHLNIIRLNNTNYMLATFNNQAAEVYALNTSK